MGKIYQKKVRSHNNMIYKALPKLESSALNGMSSIVQEAFEYKHLAMAILCLCPPDSTVYISGQ